MSQGLSANSLNSYAQALRQLGNDLALRGQSISALDHDSLVTHAKKFFPLDPRMSPALTALRGHLEPGVALGGRGRKRSVPAEDEALISEAARSSKRAANAVKTYSAVLRRLSDALSRGDQRIAWLDQEALITRARELFPQDRNMSPALNMIEEFRRGAAGGGSTEVPHLSDEDRSLIDNAVRSAGERQGLSANSLNSYAKALRQLGRDLALRGQSISALDHDSLVTHAKEFFPLDPRMSPALNALRGHLESGVALGGPGRKRSVPAEDEALISEAARSSRLSPTTVKNYSAVLRRFSEALSRGDQRIAWLDHKSLITRARELFRSP
ncbi:phage shock protein A [Bradyrhizobium elkanii]|jgi:phage shock protein A|uniref:Phage shock protein A n=3 Tax=Bradyrhizobium elkanii TaxID=29448 RepID=A0ABV4EQI3_BRAEL|nr:phage shock protein A [Bradyrhizobium elkanii]MCP1975738.1 phage shock protein A [Bradyrhizobium elkanii]MCP1984916.1 phage shock protein A [Bradyrhizobium elkanii]MCS3890730.1 phage shock protein A [Bradyrhizobium elkanii]MCS4113086.1 phage shock protein A [Bradyrhizobium elkanii]